MINDSSNPQELTDRLLISLILKISGLALLIGPFFREFMYLANVIVSQITDVLFINCLNLAFAVIMPMILLFFGDVIAVKSIREPVVIDSPAKTVVAVVKALGVIFIATGIKPLCMAIITYYQPDSYTLPNHQIISLDINQRIGNIVESGLAILLGVYLAIGASWFLRFIEWRKQGCNKPDTQPNDDSLL